MSLLPRSEEVSRFSFRTKKYYKFEICFHCAYSRAADLTVTIIQDTLEDAETTLEERRNLIQDAINSGQKTILLQDGFVFLDKLVAITFSDIVEVG